MGKEHLFKVENAAIFIDISPLMEVSWTGIANVTAQLVKEVHRRASDRTFCFYKEELIDVRAVLNAVDNPGGHLGAFIRSGHFKLGHLTTALRSKTWSIGLFPNIKPFGRVFDAEVVILHDLSAMLMPEMHEQWAAFEHTRAICRDVHTSDLICCVSEATRQDAILYLKLDPRRTFVSHLGVAGPLASPPIERGEFVLVLGTVEPRKNLRLVADYLLSRPDLAERRSFVFTGRHGWGQSFESIFGAVLADDAWKKRVHFTGFVSEVQKWNLMRSARFAIFPSIFEGFGLPVVECMSVGCPIIASRSSSLVELGLPDDMYFDPFSLEELSKVFRAVDALTRSEAADLGRNLAGRAGAFTWGAFVHRIFAALDTLPLA